MANRKKKGKKEQQKMVETDVSPPSEPLGMLTKEQLGGLFDQEAMDRVTDKVLAFKPKKGKTRAGDATPE